MFIFFGVARNDYARSILTVNNVAVGVVVVAVNARSNDASGHTGAMVNVDVYRDNEGEAVE